MCTHVLFLSLRRIFKLTAIGKTYLFLVSDMRTAKMKTYPICAARKQQTKQPTFPSILR